MDETVDCGMMAELVAISIEPPKAVSVGAELKLLRGAFGLGPPSPSLRLRLARLLNKVDAHQECIDLLADSLGSQPGLEAHFTLLTALFAAKSPEMDQLALTVAENAMSLAANDSDRCRCLAELAKAKLRLGETNEALDLLDEALELDRHSVRAFKLLVFELLQSGQAKRVVDLTAQLLGAGVYHSRILAARTMAFAALNELESARSVVNSQDYLHQTVVVPPAGWPDIAAFNAAIAKEVIENPDLRFERYGTSSKIAWRVDHPANGDTPAVAALLQCVVAVINEYVAALGESDAWIAQARPAKSVLRSWCIITESAGHERWHMHPEGWLSGGYYVEVPAGVVGGQDEAGCLAFGLPDGLLGEAVSQSFGETLVRPTPGLLTLFPSHAYHRTYPHGETGRRMCIAFDICPA